MSYLDCYFYCFNVRSIDMSCNEKISVKDVVIPELPFRGDISIFENVNIDLFTDEPLLEEAYNMEKIAFPYPELRPYEYCPWSRSNWNGCNIFGFRYTHGLINGLSSTKQGKMWAAFFKEKMQITDVKEITEIKQKEFKRHYLEWKLEFQKNRLKPIQDEFVQKMKKEYLSPEIIASLVVFKIDPVKFWYVILWLVDFIHDRTTNIVEYEQTPLESFDRMVEQLNMLSGDFWKNEKGRLTLKVGDQKTIQITNVKTLKILGEVIFEYTKRYREIKYSDEDMIYGKVPDTYMKQYSKLEGGYTYKDVFCPKVTDSSYLMKIFLFHEYMKKYLEKYNGKAGLCVSDLISDVPSKYKHNKVLINKELLISRLICVVGYGDKKSFYDDPKAIHSRLRKFRPTSLTKNEYCYFIEYYS